jgi:chorismate mutase / prephenate dehydratase
MQHCDLGIVPVENTIAGGIIETLDMLIESSVLICAEVLMAIHHNLMAKCKIEDIKKIYSKPEVFSQCRKWLSSTMPHVDIIQSGSTAQAAQRVVDEPHAAAIGSELAAELYGLKVVCQNIEDYPDNMTRFFVIGRESTKRTGNDKTAMIFSTPDKAGALVDVLQAFRSFGVNLTDIESRPSRKHKQEYFFFADCEGHITDDNIKNAIEEVRQHCLHLNVLGSFPKATEIL